MSSFPGGPTIQVGGRVFTDLTNLIILRGYATNTGYSSMFQAGSSSAYQVTAGKTLTILAIEIFSEAADNGAIFLYGDNDVGFNGASPTTPVFNFPTSTAATKLNTAVKSITSGWNYKWTIPATKYPAFEAQSGGGVGVWVTAYGYEA